MLPRMRHPLTDVTSNHTTNCNKAYSKRNPQKKKSKSYTSNTTKHDDILSNPFQTTLKITPMSPIHTKKYHKASSDSSQDDDIKKPITTPTHISTPNPRATGSIPCTPSIKSIKHIPCSISPSPFLSPGVIKSKQNIASPQRIPSISLRSFHTTNHIEFYKPIPINQCRSTQFEIVNETYDDKAIQIKTKNNTSNYVSCINITPTAINLKRNSRCLVTVSCRPRHVMRIKEVINIEWDLHSIQLYIHAVGFRKSMRTKERGQRKRSLMKMRKEDNDKCNSVQSSMESSISSSNSCNSTTTNSVRKRRKRLSPTIRREKAFTAAPFSSPAPYKLRKDFMFNKCVVQESKCSFTPKEFKKRRVIDPVNDEQKNAEVERFERLCAAVIPIQCIFRCYLAQKRMNRVLIRREEIQRRQQYYFGVIRSQIIAKRVRTMFLDYKNAANVIQCSMRTYCRYRDTKVYIDEERAIMYIQRWFRGITYHRMYTVYIRQKREEERIKRLKEESAAVYIQSWFKGMMFRRMYREHLRWKKEEMERERIQRMKEERAVMYIQRWFRGVTYRRMYRVYMRQKREEEERQRLQRMKEESAAVYIESWFRGSMYRIMYRQHLKRKKEEEMERERIQRMKEERAVVYIQRWFRGITYQRMYTQYIREKREEEERIKREFERQRLQRMKEESAAVCIESWFRGSMYRIRYKDHLKRKKEEMERERMQRMKEESAVMYIQRWFRGITYHRMYREYMRQKREEEERQRIQRMKEESAAVYIESWFRGSIHRIRYKEYLKRKKEEMERERIQRMREERAAVYIQSWFKAMVFRRMFTEQLRRKKEEMERQRIRRMREEAAVMYIQRWFRGIMYCRVYREYMQQKREEEEWIRREFERKRIQRLKEESAAVYIQSWFKGIIYQRIYTERLRRKKEEMKRQRMQRMQEGRAAVYIQIWFRGIMYRRVYIEYIRQKREDEERIKREFERQRWKEESAAVYIQSWFKGSMYRIMYRKHLIQKREEERQRIQRMRMRMEAAAVYIQSWFKGIMFHRMYKQHLIQKRKDEEREKQQREAMLMQYMSSMIQCRRIRIQYLMIRESSIVIQSVFKEYIMRKRYKKIGDSTVLIQSYIRSKLWRNQYLRIQKEAEKEKCVLGVLALWRLHKFHHIIRDKQRKIRVTNAAATYIQIWFRGIMYRRTFIEYTCKDDYIAKVIRIQSLIRGKLYRMECNRNNELLRIIKNMNNAHRNWSREKTVNYLLETALDKLIKSRTLYGVSSGCSTLQNLLKIVPNISDRIVEHNIIGALYNVLRNSNRSLPHLNLVNTILNFMLFFAKCDSKCYEAIFFRNDTLDILSERLQIHRLDFVLFELTTQLFFIGVDINVPFEDNKFLMNLRQSDVNRQIRTVKKIMSSKLEIAKRVNKPLKKQRNANIKYKKKFEQEKVLQKCVQNMHKLVDKL